LTLIAFGDSNTEGSNFYGLFPDDLNSRWVVQTGSVNAGVGGNDIVEGYNRYRADVLEKRPDQTTIMFGTNDMLLDALGNPKISKSIFELNLNKMIDWANTYGIQAILMTEPPIIEAIFYGRYPSMQSLYVAKGGIRWWANSYNEITRKVAKARGIKLIDNYANFVLKSGGSNDEQLSEFGLIDSTGTHMTPRGHGVVTYSVNYHKID